MRVVPCYDRIMTTSDYVRMISSVHVSDPTLLQSAIPEDMVHLVNRGTLGVVLAVPTLCLISVTEVRCGELSLAGPGFTTW